MGGPVAAPFPALGPAEGVVLTFPGTALPAALVPALATLVDTGIVRLIDAAVVHKGAHGTVCGAELDDENLGAVDGDVLELFIDWDLVSIAAEIERDTTTLVSVWVNRWAAEFADAVQRAGGRLGAPDRIPREAVEQAPACPP
jgi:hypothetical protein